MDAKTKFILASNSPRRKELLSLAGWEFEVSPADVDEEPLPGETPADYVCRLAGSKASAVAGKVNDSQVVIAADTTVVHQGVILGKPANQRDAYQMLCDLRGKKHQVLTALAVCRTSDRRKEQDLAITDVPMRYYSDDEINLYIATGDPFDKAGSYAIQHTGFNPVQDLSGCYANVVGLPLCHLARTLRNLDIQSVEDIPGICKERFDYDCPVHQAILEGTR